jgi:hypothetical protein
MTESTPAGLVSKKGFGRRKRWLRSVLCRLTAECTQRKRNLRDLRGKKGREASCNGFRYNMIYMQDFLCWHPACGGGRSYQVRDEERYIDLHSIENFGTYLANVMRPYVSPIPK